MSNRILISTRDFVRRENGELVSYRGDLGERQVLSYSRRLNFWPWGRVTGGSFSIGEIRIDNRSGRYDQMIFRDMRDQEISVDMPLADGGSLRVLTAIVDRAEAPNDQEIVVYLRDRLSLLDVPLQSRAFGPEADPGVQDRPLPILLGIGRSVRPTVWKANDDEEDDGPQVRIHDGPLSGLFNVRLRGDVADPFEDPAPFAIDPDTGFGGLAMASDTPQGVITVDASSSGDAYVPPSAPTPLEGIGDFIPFSGEITNANPVDLTGWVFFGTNPGMTDPETQTPMFRSFSNQAPANLIAGFTQAARSFLRTDARVLEAGKVYRWEIVMSAPVAYATFFGGTLASQGALCLRAMATTSTADRVNPLPQDGVNLFLRTTLGADNVAGTYTGTYAVPEGGVDRYVQLAALNGGIGTVARVTFREIPPPPSDELEGISLVDFELEVVRRVGMPDESISVQDLQNIDQESAAIGFFADRPITALAAVRAPLNSFGADVWTDRFGVLRFARMRDPGLEVPSLLIDENRLVKGMPVAVRPARAPGLTTSAVAQRQWYVYREGDFAPDLDIDLEERESLKREGRFLRTAVLPTGDVEQLTGEGLTDPQVFFPRLYRHAIQADPLITLHDDPDVAAVEIQRIVDLHTEVRRFVDISIWLDPGELVELDQVVFFRYPRYGFDAGRNMLLIGVDDLVESSGRRRMVNVSLWG